MSNFEYWWYHEGSGPPLPGEDGEEHCKRMCHIAWRSGAHMERQRVLEWAEIASKVNEDAIVKAERERAALLVEQMGIEGYGTLAIAAAIRKGDEDAPT